MRAGGERGEGEGALGHRKETGNHKSSDPRSAATAQLGQKIAGEISHLLAAGVSYADATRLGQGIRDSALPGDLKSRLAGDLAAALCQQPGLSAQTGGRPAAAAARPPQSRVAAGPSR